MAGIKDIAKEVGVSIGTVDRVIHNRGRVSEETKRKIEEAMEKLNYKPNHVAQGLAINKKKLNLCFVIMDSVKNPFFYDVKIAAGKRAEKLKQYGVNVHFCVLKPDLNNRVHLSEEIQAVFDEADGIAAIGVTFPEVREMLGKAEKRKVPIVFYNCCIDNMEHLAFVGCNYTDSGKLAAGLAALIGGSDARVGIFTEGLDEYRNIDSFEKRMIGFRGEIKNRYPNMIITDIQNIQPRQEQNEQMAETVLQSRPDMNVAYIVNPADYGICEAIRKADTKHRVKIITNDLVGRQKEMVENGIISATICQEPEKQGDKPLDILFKYLAYGTKPKNKNFYTKLSIHIAQNLY